ncbi:AAA family ATPase [Parendozoicomonas haliclonae]|uniref:Zeta toxin n=1 Tax=Parendozoicomonas haliclonae TaxID=1960125 RepID=A0A1X7AH97_9GAMM|nr:AAA family ATPase [Parendozoicomonas haliclonae]SMA40607.1 hypothetical protein EHSB41UT_01211 [Parendozoicomonas haliclonae]
MPELVLIRGVPGSGKTTLAKSRFPDHILCEADQFFEAVNGYEYDRSRIAEAHEDCLRRTKEHLEAGNDVVVANTFIRLWEMKAYKKLGFPCRIIKADGNYPNIHGVPDETVELMRRRFQEH